jgi:hypothetical protein
LRSKGWNKLDSGFRIIWLESSVAHYSFESRSRAHSTQNKLLYIGRRAFTRVVTLHRP